MSSKDMIDRIQESQEEVGSRVTTVTDILSMVGMFPFYLGLMQMFALDELTKLNGMFSFLVGVIIIAVTWYAPGLAAAYHVPGKKYITNYVFYGSRMVERKMELLGDPLVVARMTSKEGEDPVIETMDEADKEYAHLMKALGTQFLTDNEVDDKIDQLLKDRYERRKVEGSTGWWGRRWRTICHNRFWGGNNE